MDCKTTVLLRDGHPVVEFSWFGDDDNDQASGRGWAALVDDTVLEGHVFIHMGDDSHFRAEPFA